MVEYKSSVTLAIIVFLALTDAQLVRVELPRIEGQARLTGRLMLAMSLPESTTEPRLAVTKNDDSTAQVFGRNVSRRGRRYLPYHRYRLKRDYLECKHLISRQCTASSRGEVEGDFVGCLHVSDSCMLMAYRLSGDVDTSGKGEKL